jgi:hypothetical protein
MQKKGGWKDTRGNKPPRVSLKIYLLYFNRADSWFHRRLTKAQYHAAQKDGRMRDRTIDLLIKAKKLPSDFVDDDP